MKSYLFEHYKKKYAVGGKKVPVRKTGMWYQEGDVVVPSNEITMKGPNGEKDYFDSPIMGIGLQSGNSQVMQPGEDYFFPEDNAVLEKKMQQGAVTKSRELKTLIPQIIPGVNDVLDFNDIIQGAYSGNRTQMNQGIIGMASPGLAGKAVPTFLDYVTEKTLGKDVADYNQSKREGIVNMSTSDLQKLYTKYGPGGYDKWKKSGFPKLQKGATVESKEMTPEQQARFNAYMKTERPRDIEMPEWLSLSSGATNYARRLNNMSSEELADMPGDISDQVANAFNRGINYDVNTDLGNLGQVAFSGNYNPFGVNSLDNLYQDISYSKSFPKGSIRLTPEEQEAQFRGKQGNIKYKRRTSDEQRISELAFNLNVLPNLTMYGKGRVGEGDINIDPRNFNINSYNDGNLNIPYNVSGGLRGNLGPLNYDVSGDYNPERGYNYQGSADLSLLKNRLNLSGRVSGNQEEGLQSYSAEARARLAKGLNVKAGYRKSGENPGEFNVGLSYNKFFQSGGMSIPGVNGTMVSAMPTTIRDTYKKKKKKK